MGAGNVGSTNEPDAGCGRSLKRSVGQENAAVGAVGEVAPLLAIEQIRVQHDHARAGLLEHVLHERRRNAMKGRCPTCSSWYQARADRVASRRKRLQVGKRKDRTKGRYWSHILSGL